MFTFLNNVFILEWHRFIAEPNIADSMFCSTFNGNEFRFEYGLLNK